VSGESERACVRKRAKLTILHSLIRPSFVWQAIDWNENAIAFYESIGAKLLKEWLTLRMDEAAIDRFVQLNQDKKK